MHSTIHIRVFPSVFEKKGGKKVGLRGLYICTSLSLPCGCSVMFSLGVVCCVLLCDRIVDSLGWVAGCMLQSILRWGFDALSSFVDSLVFQRQAVLQ